MKKNFLHEDSPLYDYLLGYSHARYHVTFLPRPKKNFNGKSKHYIWGYFDAWITYAKLNF